MVLNTSLDQMCSYHSTFILSMCGLGRIHLVFTYHFYLIWVFYFVCMKRSGIACLLAIYFFFWGINASVFINRSPSFHFSHINCCIHALTHWERERGRERERERERERGVCSLCTEIVMLLLCIVDYYILQGG